MRPAIESLSTGWECSLDDAMPSDGSKLPLESNDCVSIDPLAIEMHAPLVPPDTPSHLAPLFSARAKLARDSRKARGGSRGQRSVEKG